MATHELKLISRAGKVQKLEINGVPRSCPQCHEFSTVNALGAVESSDGYGARRDALAVFQCGNIRCGVSFVAPYAITVSNGKDVGSLLSHMPLTAAGEHDYSQSIRDTSPTFCETYDQAVHAEENGLTEICGAGFRRALEFLVKDYATSRVPKDDARVGLIARCQLAQCIADHLPPGPVQEAAKRATWLGNDETHYYRAWVDHDIDDLKALILLTTKWVDYMIETDRYMAKMPGPKKR